MLENNRHLIVLAPGWVYNTFDGAVGLSAGTSYYSASSGTYYSGGNGQGYNDINGYNSILQASISPGLTIGGSTSGEIGKYGVNKNGQTFGIVNNSTADEDYPDLVGAVGLD